MTKILTDNIGSFLEYKDVQSIGVDKLIFTLINGDISLNLLDIIKSQDRRTNHKLRDGLCIKYSSKRRITIIVNPNRFSSMNECFQVLIELVGYDVLSKAKLTRIDLNMDLAIEYAKFVRGLDFSNKIIKSAYNNYGCRINGIVVGGRPETIVVYDKMAQTGLENPCTRVEFRLQGKKVPFRNVAEVFEKFSMRLEQSSCLNKVKLLRIRGIENQSKRLIEKYRNFLHEVLKQGFYHLRKTENKGGNFARYAKRFFVIKENKLSIKDAFIKKAKEQLANDPILPISLKKAS